MLTRKTINCCIGVLKHRIKEIRGNLKYAEFFYFNPLHPEKVAEIIKRYECEEHDCLSAIAELEKAG